MIQALTAIHVLVALSIIGMVLLQQGRGADAGAGFGGGGASNTVFGARGSASFLTRTTAILAAVFFSTSMLLAHLGDRPDNRESDIMEAPTEQQAQPDLPKGAEAPQAPAPSDLPVQIDVPKQGAGKP
jgi:preprotein translocase subunit SecG